MEKTDNDKGENPLLIFLAGLSVVAVTAIIFVVSIPILILTKVGLMSWVGAGIIAFTVAFLIVGTVICYRTLEHQWTWRGLLRASGRWLPAVIVGGGMYWIELGAVQSYYRTISHLDYVPVEGHILVVTTAIVMALYMRHLQSKS